MKQKNVTEFIRVEKTRNYTVIHNQFLKRSDLSWKAKGILTYILSLPDDWNINLKEVMTHATEGERAFRSGWDELAEKGYVERKPVREGNRIKFWETIVRETVDVKPLPVLCGFEDVQNVHVQNEDVQNSNLLSTEGTKYLNKQSTDSSPAKAEPIPFKEIISYLNEQTGRNYSHTAKGNNDFIRARWNEGFRLDDFKQVIDNKVKDWLNNKEMNQYLRPQTLFNNKFDMYLNQYVKPAKTREKPKHSVGYDDIEKMLGGNND